MSSVGNVAYGRWIDDREVVGGDDPRYASGQGFDVKQCRTQLADGIWGPDTRPSAGGLDQGIFGASLRR